MREKYILGLIFYIQFDLGVWVDVNEYITNDSCTGSPELGGELPVRKT